MKVADDIAQVRGPGVSFYVLRDRDDLYLIDGGFLGGVTLLQRELKRIGWNGLGIRGILLTHGHLDHTLNLVSLQRLYGAWVAAAQADEAHILGAYPYRGPSGLCGVLESVGRALFSYKPCAAQRWLLDDEQLPLLEGLRVISLPGHTGGHVGFYLTARRLLFCGDLFRSTALASHLPPRFLNTSQDELYRSVRKVMGMELEGILPNHADIAPPAVHLARFRKLAARKGLF